MDIDCCSTFRARKCKRGYTKVGKGKNRRCLKKCKPGQKRRKRKPRRCYGKKKRKTTKKGKKSCKCKPIKLYVKDAAGNKYEFPIVGYTEDGKAIYQNYKLQFGNVVAGGQFYKKKPGKGSKAKCKCMRKVYLKDCGRSAFGPCKQDFSRPKLCPTKRPCKGGVQRRKACFTNPPACIAAYRSGANIPGANRPAWGWKDTEIDAYQKMKAGQNLRAGGYRQAPLPQVPGISANLRQQIQAQAQRMGRGSAFIAPTASRWSWRGRRY